MLSTSRDFLTFLLELDILSLKEAFPLSVLDVTGKGLLFKSFTTAALLLFLNTLFAHVYQAVCFEQLDRLL